jgi:hypothetical protein
VNVRPTEDKQITVEYDPDYFNASVKNIDGNWTVNISSKVQNINGAPTAILYLPTYKYGSVNLDLEIATMNLPLLSGNITANAHLSYVMLDLQKGFRGSLNYASKSGTLYVTSADEYINSNVKITNDVGIVGTVYVPNNFTKNGSIYTYTNGTQDNIISITLEEFGAVSLR